MKRGFTLIELMVVVGIIALLAAVSVPSFSRFLAKSKRAEAYVNLHAIYVAQKSYWAEHGRYSDALAGVNSIGWQPEGYQGGGSKERFYYTYGFANGTEGRNFFTGKLAAAPSELARSYASPQGFLVVAAGDIDSDGTPDIITIDHHNNIVIVQDDLL